MLEGVLKGVCIHCHQLYSLISMLSGFEHAGISLRILKKQRLQRSSCKTSGLLLGEVGHNRVVFHPATVLTTSNEDGSMLKNSVEVCWSDSESDVRSSAEWCVVSDISFADLEVIWSLMPLGWSCSGMSNLVTRSDGWWFQDSWRLLHGSNNWMVVLYIDMIGGWMYS